MTEKKMPQGVPVGNGKIKIATVFDEDVFNRICERARKEKLTFSEAANDTMKCGLLCLEEAGE